MPLLPDGGIAQLAVELRAMRSSAAIEVWSHPAWSGLYAWVARRVPECDPIRPAIHVVRLAPLVRADRDAAGRVGRRILAIARRSLPDRRRDWEVPLDRDLAERLVESRPIPRSLAVEAFELFRRTGIAAIGPAWEEISGGIDIAADWLDAYAQRSGLTGEALFAGASPRSPACAATSPAPLAAPWWPSRWGATNGAATPAPHLVLSHHCCTGH